MPTANEFTKILSWPGYRVYQHEIDEKTKTLRLWVRRKPGNRKIECSGCGRKFAETYDASERAVRDLPWSEFRTTVFVEIYRVKCPDCGVKREKVLLLPSKAPFSKRFEEAVGWPRTVAGIQSMLSAILITLAAVSNFVDVFPAF